MRTIEYDPRTRVYTIQTEGVPKVCIIGCSGTGDPQAYDNLHEMAKARPDGLILGGDNVYGPCDSGLSTGTQLRQQIVEPLGQANCPAFLVTGNHEGEIQGAYYHDEIDQLKKLKPAGIARLSTGTNWPARAWYRQKIRDGAVNAQKLQTFLNHDTTGTAPAFAGAPENPLLNLQDDLSVRKFHMPEGGYYSQCYVRLERQDGNIDIEYIVLNTNTLPYDAEQRAWLIERLNHSTADRIVIVGHHPMQEKTLGKRRYKKEDGYMYAEAMAELAALKKAHRSEKIEARQEIWSRFEILRGLSGSGHGDQLCYVWKHEILPNVSRESQNRIVCLLAAHDHFTAVVANQITLGGGGGGKLDKPVYDDPQTLYAQKQSAFAIQEVVNGQLSTSIVKGCAGQLTSIAQVDSFKNEKNELKTQICYVSSEKGTEGLHKKSVYTHTTDGGFRVDHYEAQDIATLMSEATQPIRSVVQKAETMAISELDSLCDRLESALTEFATKLGLGTMTALAFSRSKSEDQFKRLHTLLTSMRDFMYELKKEAIAKPGQHKKLEHLIRVLLRTVDVLKRQLSPGADGPSLPREDVRASTKELKKFMQKYASTGRFESVCLPVMSALALVLFLVKLCFGSDVAFHTPEMELSNAGKIALLTMTLYISQMGMRVWHAKVESRFEVKLDHLLQQLTQTLQHFQAPLPENAVAIPIPGTL